MKMKGIRRSSMIQEVPVKFSDRVLVNNGNDAHCLKMEGEPSKSNAVREIVKTCAVAASLCIVFLCKGNRSMFRFNAPSRITLLDEIDHLKHDLEPFEKVKEQLVEEEVHLNWDKQRIAESEDIVSSMVASSKELSARFHEEEIHLQAETHRMHEDIQKASKLSSDAAKHDHDTVHDLSSDIQATYLEAKHEHEETVALRRQVYQTMQELRKQNIEVPNEVYERLNALHLHLPLN